VDLVVTDIVMPKLDGFELIRAVHQHHPGTKIVAVSGMPPLGAMTLVEAARRLGADDAIAKPFKASELRHIVLCCLDSVGTGLLSGGYGEQELVPAGAPSLGANAQRLTKNIYYSST